MRARFSTLWTLVVCALAGACTLSGLRAETRVPAFTAYLDPIGSGAEVSPRSGVRNWTDPKQRVLWFGEFKTPGDLDASVVLRLPAGNTSRLRLTISGQSHDVTVSGEGAQPVTARFGTYTVKEAGYLRLVLESMSPAGGPIGNIEALTLDGAAARDAHFNRLPRRNTASVHLFYRTPRDAPIEAFYCEVTALDDPLWTFDMACGWHRGYLGMQVNGPAERQIIFSVWDNGQEKVSRDKVADADRVKLIARGEGVVVRDFGNEGTGGHSHLVYNWATGTKQRFVITARPADATHTVYSGYYFHPEKKRWMLISSWLAPGDGDRLRGLHSFVEDWGGENGHLRRRALFGNQWIRRSGGEWTEITQATFSHDDTGRAERLDRSLSIQKGQFMLSTGGFTAGSTVYGTLFTRPARGKAPDDIVLPPLPSASGQ